jgi:hypothetical protein
MTRLSSREVEMIRKLMQIAVLLALPALPVAAQITIAGADSQESQGPATYGSGKQPQTGYAGDILSQNLVSVSVDGETAYDTDALNTGQGIRADETFTLGPRFGLVEGRKKFNVAIDYLPYFIIYRRFSDFDTVNHALDFDSSAQVTSRFALRLRNSTRYISTPTGTFEPRSSTTFVSGLTSPTDVNLMVLVPQARRLYEDARLDAIYEINGRSSFDVSGNFLDQRFSHATSSAVLYNMKGGGGSANYMYRLNQNSTLGVVYEFQNLTFGSGSRIVTHSALLSYAQQISPTVTFTVFAGPQFTRDHDSFQFELPFLTGHITLLAHVVHSKWSPVVGGTLTKRSKSTTFGISAQHRVSSGGGFLRAVTSTGADFSIRRRLTARWEGTTDVDYAQQSALTFGAFESKIRYGGAGFGLERTLSEKLKGRLQYNFLSQRSSGQVPIAADLDRSRISLGFFYEIGSAPLGR